jgi:hypothetical protein
MKSLYIPFAFIAIAGLTGCNLDKAFADSYEAPKILYGMDIEPCVASSENMVAYSHYEEGRLQCEKHQVEGDQDVKQRLAELKLAYPVKVRK